MRPPNPRLSNVGFGNDTVSVYKKFYTQDIEGNLVVNLTSDVVSYRAVVEMGPGSESTEDGTVESVATYQILLYTQADPQIRDGDTLFWTNITMVAQGSAAQSAAGAYSVVAIEIEAPSGQPDTPYGLEQ